MKQMQFMGHFAWHARLATTCGFALWGATACGSAPADGNASASVEEVAQDPQYLEAPDEEYEPTPNGRVHKSCLHVVESGARLHADGSVDEGRKHTEFEPCRYRAKQNLDSDNAGHERTGLNPVPTINGWIEDRHMNATTNAAGFNWFNELDARWVVPAAPTTYHGQSNYFFTGLMPSPNGSFLLQPVLSHGLFYPTDGGNWWSVALWFINGNTTTRTGYARVNPGDTIRTYMHATSCTNAGICTWLASIFVDTPSGTAFPIVLSVTTPDRVGTAMQGVLESYKISSCSDLPNAASLDITKTWLSMPQGGADLLVWPGMVSWNTVANVRSVTPNCGFTTSNPTADSVRLFF